MDISEQEAKQYAYLRVIEELVGVIGTISDEASQSREYEVAPTPTPTTIALPKSLDEKLRGRPLYGVLKQVLHNVLAEYLFQKEDTVPDTVNAGWVHEQIGDLIGDRSTDDFERAAQDYLMNVQHSQTGQYTNLVLLRNAASVNGASGDYAVLTAFHIFDPDRMEVAYDFLRGSDRAHDPQALDNEMIPYLSTASTSMPSTTGETGRTQSDDGGVNR
jgi:hypothetical protein